MAEIIEGPFAEILARGRERFNQRFAAVYSASPSFDPAEFMQHLRGPVAGIVNKIAAAEPSCAGTAAIALYDASLDLFRANLLGSSARTDIVACAWRELLPLLTGFLIKNPGPVAASIFNALNNLSEESGDKARSWMTFMIEIAPFCKSVQDLNHTGLVLAWRCGLAHYRATALDRWDKLQDDLKLRTLNIDPESFRGNIADMGARLRADPWYTPGSDGINRKPDIAAVCGGFAGFGGPFSSPPCVMISGGNIIAMDTNYIWILHADSFGSNFRRLAASSSDNPDPSNPAIEIKPDGTVIFNGTSTRLPELSNCSSFASNADTLAVTLDQSHYVYIVAPIQGK